MKQTTQQKIKENITKRTLRILKANKGMKDMELFKAVYQRSPMLHIDRVGHELAQSWIYEVVRPLQKAKIIIPVGGSGKGYMVNEEFDNQ